MVRARYPVRKRPRPSYRQIILPSYAFVAGSSRSALGSGPSVATRVANLAVAALRVVRTSAAPRPFVAGLSVDTRRPRARTGLVAVGRPIVGNPDTSQIGVRLSACLYLADCREAACVPIDHETPLHVRTVFVGATQAQYAASGFARRATGRAGGAAVGLCFAGSATRSLYAAGIGRGDGRGNISGPSAAARVLARTRGPRRRRTVVIRRTGVGTALRARARVPARRRGVVRRSACRHEAQTRENERTSSHKPIQTTHGCPWPRRGLSFIAQRPRRRYEVASLLAAEAVAVGHAHGAIARAAAQRALGVHAVGVGLA
jgi:hypothetical protein